MTLVQHPSYYIKFCLNLVEWGDQKSPQYLYVSMSWLQSKSSHVNSSKLLIKGACDVGSIKMAYMCMEGPMDKYLDSCPVFRNRVEEETFDCRDQKKNQINLPCKLVTL